MLRQINYPKSQHCPRGQEEFESYLDDLDFATKYFDDRAEEYFDGWLAHDILIEADAANLQELSKHYTLDTESTGYLLTHVFLIKSLENAVKQIHKYFGETTKCALDVLREHPKSDGKLFVNIHTVAPLETAMKMLNRFDEEWWFGQLPLTHKHLEFALEFAEDGV